MTGWVYVTSPCITCSKVFSYNPHHVPSTSAITGSREPVCRECMDAINAQRVKLGLEPFEIMPDAYEAIREDQL